MVMDYRHSPERRMQRTAFLTMKQRFDGGQLGAKKLRQYGAACHQMGLWLRAHGLAHVVAVLATEAASGADSSRPREFIHDFQKVLASGFPLGLPPARQALGDAALLAAWHAALCGEPPLDLRSYMAQSRMALRAADAMKSMAEIALGLDRADVGDDVVAQELTHG